MRNPDSVELEKGVIAEPPNFLNDVTVLKWSEHYGMLQGVEKGQARRTKAKKLLMEKCFVWSRKKKHWICKPIKDYNKTFYHLTWIKTKTNFKTGMPGEFQCSCQFAKTTDMMCSHILGLYLYLKKRNWRLKLQKGQEILPIKEEEIEEDPENAGKSTD